MNLNKMPDVVDYDFKSINGIKIHRLIVILQFNKCRMKMRKITFCEVYIGI